MLQNGLFEGVTDADIALPASAESDAGSEADLSFEEQPAAEIKGIGEAVDAREEIEGAFGLRDGDAFHAAQGGEAEVPVFLEHFDEFGDGGVAMIERGFTGFLDERRGATDDELVELGGFLSEVTAGDEPAKTPTGHAPGLGEALDDENGVMAGGELENAGNDGTAVIDEPFIDFVGEEPKVVAAGKIEELLLLFDGGDPAEGVGGRGVDEKAGTGREGGFELSDVNGVAVIDERLSELNRPGAVHLEDGTGVGPGGGEDEGVIAGINGAADADVEGLDAGVGDNDFVFRIERDALMTLVIAGDGFAGGEEPGVGRVIGEAVVHRLGGGVLEELRGGQVGLAEIEFQDVVHRHGYFGQLTDTGVRDGARGGGYSDGHLISIIPDRVSLA